MKNKCNIAKDLMPLCIDGVASEESQQYVDEHIAECTECAVTYGSMKVELPRANEEKERNKLELAAKRLRRKRLLRGVTGTVVGIVIFMAVYLGVPKFLEWYKDVHYEEQFMKKYVCENGDLTLDALYYDVSRSSENMGSRVQTDIYSFPSGNPKFDLMTKGVAVNDDTGVCVQYRAVYTGLGEHDTPAGYNAWYGTIKDGQWIGKVDNLRDENGYYTIWLPIVRIELHAGDEFVVLWEEGDELQTPQDATAKRKQVEAEYSDK